MSADKNKEKFSPAQTGNASNPEPRDVREEPKVEESLFGEQAQTYLRESGNIEDLADARQQKEAADSIRKDENEDRG